MTEPRKPVLKEIPEVVTNPQNGKRYLRGRFLGKGGFARCYELTDVDTRQLYAGKIVSKTLLVKKHQKDKVHVLTC
jgi:polo-like kinase 1